MILDVCTYLIVFMVAIFLAFIYQKYCNRIAITSPIGNIDSDGYILNCLMGCVFLTPIIVMYGMRYGIGTDYFSYEQIYDILHDTSFADYWFNHNDGVGVYYVEPFYYLLNVVMPSYRILQWCLGVIIYSLLCTALKEYYGKINFAYALFIYLSTQFIYSMNGTRFSIAICFLLLAYIFLAKGRGIRFVQFVLLASMFHTSALFCLPIYLLKEYRGDFANKIRNIGIIFFIILFPLIVEYLFEFAASIAVFARYFLAYSINSKTDGGFMWIIHIIPVILPLVFFCRKEIFYSTDTSVYFRICLMEVPFRILGHYNMWFARYARCSQIILVILIPLILSRIRNRYKKLLLELYYIIWYIFYFAYYAMVNDQGASLPYTWIFS